MKSITLIGIFLVLTVQTEAQTLSGTVLDMESGQPLSGVTVAVVGSATRVMTRDLGIFTLNTPLGSRLRFSRIGYASDSLIFSSDEVPFVVRLRPIVIRLPPVDVVGKRDLTGDIAGQPAFATIIDRESFDNQVTSLPEILDRSVGLQVQSLGGLGAFSTVSVRGSSSEQIEVYLDDVLMNAASGGGVNLSNLPLANIGQIKVSRGAEQGGNGLGGTVHIRTRDSDSTRRGISASWGSFDTREFNAIASGKFKRARYLAIADYTASDNNFGFLDNNGTEYNANDDQLTDRRNNKLDSGSLLGKATVDLQNSRSLFASQTLFWKRQGIPGISNNQTLSAHFNTFRAMTQICVEDKAIGDLVSSKATAYFTHLGETFQDSLGEIGTGRQNNTYQTRTTGLRIKLQGIVFGKHILSLHTDVRRETYDPEARIQLITPLFASHRWTLQTRATSEISLADDRLLWTSGVDIRHHRSRFVGRNPFAFSPLAPDSLNTRNMKGLRTGIRAGLFGSLTAKANVARSNRAPSFFELFGDRGSVVGNTRLEPETATCWDAGIRLNRKDQWLETVYFDHRYEDLIQFAQTSQATSRPENVGEARVNGVEVSGGMRLGDWIALSSNYTFLNSKNRSSVPHLIDNALPGKPRHKASTRVDIRISRVSTSYDYAFEDGNFLDQANRRKLESRHVHSASISVNVWKSIQVGLDARNITDARLNDLWGYPLPGRSWFGSIQESWQ
ncbi:MAG: TonB-dependent receptor [Candidatus Latescibacterota bacterium]|nr:TonB-dependent receptor [Candidatus Latescibacterota bacterium]